MVTSRAVVGSSAISSFGSQAERDGDHHALPHAAGELVRIGAEALGGGGDADELEQFDGALAGLAREMRRDGAGWSRSPVRRRVRVGLSEVIGSWKIMPISSPRSLRRSRSSSLSRSWPSNRAEPRYHLAVGLEQAEQRHAGDRLARAALADNAEDFAGVELE